MKKIILLFVVAAGIHTSFASISAFASKHILQEEACDPADEDADTDAQ